MESRVVEKTARKAQVNKVAGWLVDAAAPPRAALQTPPPSPLPTELTPPNAPPMRCTPLLSISALATVSACDLSHFTSDAHSCTSPLHFSIILQGSRLKQEQARKLPGECLLGIIFSTLRTHHAYRCTIPRPRSGKCAEYALRRCWKDEELARRICNQTGVQSQ
ncbi:hypothetical protein K402DRAFT_274580 [Aulographum hederae CBS 113979]|uniref:Uncharacterized protein n=1 Tax=Aulographum hederae CBS 113979 TaxID=1176131 RepID=A0A6G1GIE6_9PEZI|nr:hypothetical protein K402DRAFT_274580 [Aulographum hederae CBS 113979]